MWKRKLTDIGEVADAIERARKYQEERGLPLSLQAIAAELGCRRDLIAEYVSGKSSPPDGASEDEKACYEGIVALLARAYSECDRGISNIMMEKGNTMGAQFIAKNCFGYKDKQEVEATVALPTFAGEGELE